MFNIDADYDNFLADGDTCKTLINIHAVLDP